LDEYTVVVNEKKEVYKKEIEEFLKEIPNLDFVHSRGISYPSFLFE